MAIRFGPIDPLELIFGLINKLLIEGVISQEEAEEIIRSSLDPSLSEEEKEDILNSLKGEPKKENGKKKK